MLVERPVISVVLPTFNGQEYLHEAIESVVTQTWHDWELIIVDDCSTDDTPRIVTRFAERDARIRSFRNTSNLKLPASLNVGFSRACGRFFTWISDDNRFLPAALADMLAELEQHPEVGLVYSDYVYVDEAGNEISGWLAGPRELLLLRNCVGSCFLYRRDVHERLGGYRESMFCVEDYDFWVRASGFFDFRPLTGARFQHRLHEASLSATQTQRIDDLCPMVFVSNMASLSWASPAAKRELLARLCCWTLHQGKVSLARGLFLKSFPHSLAALLNCKGDELFVLLFGGRAARTKRRLGRALKRRIGSARGHEPTRGPKS